MTEEVDVAAAVSRALLAAGDVVTGAVASALHQPVAVDALVAILDSESSRPLAIRMNESLHSWFLQEAQSSNSDLTDLLARTLERVVSATAGQSHQSVVRAQRDSLCEFATFVAGEGAAVLRTASAATESPSAPISSEQRPLDHDEWLRILQHVRDQCGSRLSDECLGVVAGKLKRQFLQAALAALTSRRSDFRHLRLMVFQNLLLQFPFVAESVVHGAAAQSAPPHLRQFLAWAESRWNGSDSELFGDDVRQRWPQDAAGVDAAVSALQTFVTGTSPLTDPGERQTHQSCDDFLAGSEIPPLTPELRQRVRQAWDAASTGPADPAVRQRALESIIEQNRVRLMQVREQIARLHAEERELQTQTRQQRKHAAALAFARGDLPAAERELHALLAEIPDDFAALDQWAQLCGARGELDEVRQTYGRLRHLAAEDSYWKMLAARNLGQHLLRGNDPAGAKAALIEAIADFEELNPDAAEAGQLGLEASDWLVTVGDLELAEGHRTAALQHFRRSLALQSTSPLCETADRPRRERNARLLSRMGDLALAEGERAAALDHYRESLALAELLVPAEQAAGADRRPSGPVRCRT